MIVSKNKAVSLSKILGLVLVIFSIVIVILFFRGNERFKIFRLSAETPSIINYYLLRGAVKNRNFDQVVIRLNRQLDFVQSLSNGNNHILPGLLKNISYAFDHAETESELDKFQLFFDKLVNLYPELYEPRIWYAKTLLNDSALLVFDQVDKAIILAGSDSRSYRVAIEASLKYGLKNDLTNYCKQYKNNQLGGVTQFDKNLLFYGIGARSLMLEVKNRGGGSMFIENNGLTLEDNIDYEFNLPENINLSTLRLYIAVQAGIIMKINQVSLGLSGKNISQYVSKDITLTTADGFLMDNGYFTSSKIGRSTKVNIYLDELKTVEADKITVNMSVSKAALTNSALCSL